MNIQKYQIERWVLLAINLIWIGGWGYNTYLTPKPYSYAEQRYQNELNRCAGKFADRYDCKASLIDSHNAEKFAKLVKEMGIILGPPLVLYGVYSFTAKRRREQERNQVTVKRRKKHQEAHKEAKEMAAKRAARVAVRKAEKKDKHDPDSIVGGASMASIEAEFAAMDKELTELAEKEDKEKEDQS